MGAEDDTVQRNLKFKITVRGLRDDSEQKTCEKVDKVVVKCGQGREAVNENYGSKFLVKPSVPCSTRKRGPEFPFDGQRGKIRRMDRAVKLQCGSVLKELMNHPKGWIFSEPVDPVKYNIPDYFSIIKKPMDLGTIKLKLEENLYFNAEEFADDVRLTFSNAMLYNPVSHSVHIDAKWFNGFFSKRWKSLEAKLKAERAKLKGQDSKQTVGRSCQDSKPIGLNRALVHSKPDNSMPMSLKEKHKTRVSVFDKKRLESELSEVSKGKVTEKMQTSSSDISSDRSPEHDHCGDSRLNLHVKYPPTIHTNRLRPDSDGPGAVLNEDSCAHLSTPATAVLGEGWSSFTDRMSPKRALRAAMLKSRFASTIFKATHQDDNSDPVKMKQERERLEREQLEEKERIEKEMKAVETARQMKQAELKMQREREREAARMALQKIEQSVDFDENLKVLKELELMCRPTASMRGASGGHVSPLAQLGLYLKDDDYLEEENEDAVLTEEGEIL